LTKSICKTTANLEESVLKNTKIIIRTSRNLITPGGYVFLAADLLTDKGKLEEITPSWSIETKVPGIRIEDHGILKVSRNTIIEKDEILKISAKVGNSSACKEILLTKKDPLLLKCKIHYFRFDKNSYKGWNIWAWNPNSHSHQVDFVEETDFGMLAGVDKDNIIIRYSEPDNHWKFKDTGDIHLKGWNEVFIIEGNHRIFTNFRQALNEAKAKVLSATMDSRNSVTAFLTNKPSTETLFHLYADNKLLETVVADGQQVNFNITGQYDFDPSALFEVRAEKGFLPGRVTMRRVLDSLYYDGDDLGATFCLDKIRLRVWAPTASSVSLMLYNDYRTDSRNGHEILMKKSKNGTWAVTIDRAKYYGKLYMYKLNFYPGTDYAFTNYAVDPYAKALSVNGNRGGLIDTQNDPDTFFPGWKPSGKPPLKSLTDSIIYELHVRDLSMDKNSGINPEYRGKFVAFSQNGTVHPQHESIKTGLDHIEELGITHVHLLPVYDFATVDEEKTGNPVFPQFNWGYDPKNYNAPEGSYSTDPFDPVKRIREFRQMVQAIHDKNLRVVMDVVYNHTYETTTFDRLVPGYYYRTDHLCRYTNGSGCGNEIATERPMIRKFIVDSLKHWVKTYNVDGFRFDLMGLIDIDTMIQIVRELRTIDPGLLIYGEPWTAGGSSLPGDMQTTKGRQRNLGFSVFNDHFRDAIRGNNSFPHPSRAYVTGEMSALDKIINGVMGAINDFAASPAECINYVAAHDDYCLWDHIIAASGHVFPQPCIPERLDHIPVENQLNDPRVRRIVLALGIILTSQGIPFIHAGDEMIRTKYGNHNSYNSPDQINMIRWDWKKNHNEVYQYIKGLVKLRREHQAFRMTSRDQILSHFRRLMTPDRVTAFLLVNHANGDKWGNIVVIYNPHLKSQVICLPPGEWTVVVNEKEAGTTITKTGINTASGCINVPPVSLMVMHD
jgi:pullulanase